DDPPEEEECQRDDDECRFHERTRFDVGRRLRFAAPAVEDEEQDRGQPHRGRHDERRDDDEVMELVDGLRERRCLIGQEKQTAERLVHAPLLLRFHSWRQRTPSPTARARKDANAPPRTKFIAYTRYRPVPGS